MARQTPGERYTQRLQRRLEDIQSIHELVREIAVDEFSKIKLRKTPKMPRRRKSAGKYEAVLVLSDFQAGKRSPSYDGEVFRRRLLKLASPTIELCERWSVDTLHVFSLGDLVEGSVIFPHQPHTIDRPAFLQACRLVPEACYELVHELLPHFRKLTWTEVPGNHGRQGRKGDGSSELDNNDSVAMVVLEALLKPERDAGRVEFSCAGDPNWWNYREVLGNGCLLVHGNELSCNAKSIKDAMLGWHADPSLPPFKLVFMGHWHQRLIVSANGLEARISPSLDSDCQFAERWCKATSEPAQMLYVFHRKHCIVGEHELKVDRL